MKGNKYVSHSQKQKLLKAMAVELEQTTLKSMLTELRQLVLVGCEVEMYEKALNDALDEAISLNIRLHDVELVLQRAVRNLFAITKVSQAAVRTEYGITVESETKHKTTTEADVKVTLLDSEEMKWKKHVPHSKKQRLLQKPKDSIGSDSNRCMPDDCMIASK